MTPIEAFEKGWNDYNSHFLMPAGIWNKATSKTDTWEDLLKGMTLDQAFDFGREKSCEYLMAVTGDEP